MISDKVGPEAARRAFAQIARAGPESELSAPALEAVQFGRALLKHVFSDAAEIEAWLVELAAGRFDAYADGE